MEGISSIVDGKETSSRENAYSYGRKLMAGDLNAAVEGALEAGVKEIVAADAHGGKRNLLPEDVHESVKLMRGTPRPFSMMTGINEEFDAALYVGYHAMKGTMHGILSHTISGGTVDGIFINGTEMGEFGLNAALAGWYNVPSIFLSGDKAATDEAERFVPGMTTATVKWAASRSSATCLHPNKSRKLIRQKVKEAIEGNKRMIFSVNEPVKVKMKFARASMCDTASLMPSFDRLDGRTINGEFEDYPTATNALRAAIYLAGAA